MKVLVVVASHHRGTREIGARVAATLRAAGIAADIVDAKLDPDPAGYDGVILGSGIYFGRWLPSARHYVRKHATALGELRLWTFSSGPVDEPRRVGSAEPVPSGLVDVAPIEHVTFGGRIAGSELNIVERIVTKAVHAGTADFRDWTTITQWAAHIAASLTADGPVPRRLSA
jgi:menaquinone-dependent protoporphyrinogen oxidase